MINLDKTNVDTKRYFEILSEFEKTGLPFNGTHDIMNYVSSAHPDKIDVFAQTYEFLAKLDICTRRIEEIDDQIVAGVAEFETEAECKAYIQGIEYVLYSLFGGDK